MSQLRSQPAAVLSNTYNYTAQPHIFIIALRLGVMDFSKKIPRKDAELHGGRRKINLPQTNMNMERKKAENNKFVAVRG